MARSILLGTLALLATLAGGAEAQGPTDDGDARVEESARIRPGDVVRLSIWREPDLSGEFPVDEKGEVVLPRLGRRLVGEESSRTLEAELIREYERFLQHSSIDVTILRRIQVLGAVRNPGLYPVDPTMTVADAVALAGGANSEGDPERVRLIRGGEQTVGTVSASTSLSGMEIRSGDQLFVPYRNWISRYPGVVAAGLSAGVSLIIALISR